MPRSQLERKKGRVEFRPGILIITNQGLFTVLYLLPSPDSQGKSCTSLHQLPPLHCDMGGWLSTASHQT